MMVFAICLVGLILMAIVTEEGVNNYLRKTVFVGADMQAEEEDSNIEALLNKKVVFINEEAIRKKIKTHVSHKEEHIPIKHKKSQLIDVNNSMIQNETYDNIDNGKKDNLRKQWNEWVNNTKTCDEIRSKYLKKVG